VSNSTRSRFQTAAKLISRLGTFIEMVACVRRAVAQGSTDRRRVGHESPAKKISTPC
jgi:hypothetical protein